MPLSKIDNKNFYYEQHGAGADLVLISGFTADHSTWSFMLDDLAKHYRVLVFDNPGVGRSFIPESDYSLQKMCADVGLLLDSLDIQQAHFIGHSMGAALTMQMCLDQPQRVKKAVLAGGPAVLPITSRLQMEGLKYSYENNFDLDYVFLSVLPWLFGPKFLSDADRLAQVKNMLLTNPYPQTLAGFSAQLNVLHDYDLSAKLSEINTECLIVAGDEDLLVPMRYMNFLHENISGTQFEIIREGVGHMFHIEEPEQLTRSALNFFKINT